MSISMTTAAKIMPIIRVIYPENELNNAFALLKMSPTKPEGKFIVVVAIFLLFKNKTKTQGARRVFG